MAQRFRPDPRPTKPPRDPRVGRSARSRRSFSPGKRGRGTERSQDPFLPPENWYEPGAARRTSDYIIVVQEPGPGYCHAVSASDIRERLAWLPPHMVAPLEVVQLSRMTRKKQSAPCYGMQWGNALYLYPIEDSLVEYFVRPPQAAERREAEMYGGRWEKKDGRYWRLVWTPDTIRDFYLNNILLHELGHLLDQRNRSYADRERFADWFAIEYGYRSSRRASDAGPRRRRVVRRHAGNG